uniref:Haloacid dehalogenase-like hydrolase domain-containing protein 2 n=1 Tax=Glossina brevipalpis TaxID=37001 RepID=A0A1A9WGT9_9MUSC
MDLYNSFISICKEKFYKAQMLRRLLENAVLKSKPLNLNGTLHVEYEPIPNSIQALNRLRYEGIAVKFVTNSDKLSNRTLLNRLLAAGFTIQQKEIHSSLSAGVKYVCKNNLNPYYLVSKDARMDFPENDEKRPFDSVMIGLAPEEYSYENLNKAFNILLTNKNAKLIAMQKGKYYKRKNDLTLGPGLYVKGVEYVVGAKAIILGKPNAYFFRSAIDDDVNVNECVMIGDDIRDDIMGAMKVGFKAIQVKTGKYLPDIVAVPSPTILVENFCEAVDWILENRYKKI